MVAAALITEVVQELKPRLRGWLHLVMFPLSVAAGLVLISSSPDATMRWASIVFTLTASMLFGSSALLHRGPWPPRWHSVVVRLDHVNIFLLIAGTYTTYALMLLDGTSKRALLVVVWGGALAGIAFRVIFTGAPRWLYLPVYIAMGWSAVFWYGDFADTASPAVLTMIVSGCVLYLLGGVVYGVKRPNPNPAWFGFHEVFHSFTVAAFTLHYVGVSLIVYGAR